MARRTTTLPPVAPPASRRSSGSAAAPPETPPADAPPAADSGPTGFLGGRLYPPEKLAALEGYLARRGVRLLVGDEHVPRGMAGAFCYDSPGGPTIILGSNPTCYLVWHEMIHYLHYKEIGAEAYAALSRGGKEGNVPEQAVFDFLENNRKRWDALTPEEQRHAIDYIEAVGGFR